MAVSAAQRRIVDHLKVSGPTTTAELAAALDVTTQAVRPPLADLETAGLVRSETIATGSRGRPPVGWALTADAIELFPDRHGELTVELLDAIRATVGEDGLAAVLAERDRSQLAALRADFAAADEIAAGVEAADEIAERVAVLARHRSRQGYMAEVRADGDDLLLVEHHCPVCAAATVCQGLCASELELFRSAIGPGARVERTEHLLADGERCVYRIRRRGA